MGTNHIECRKLVTARTTPKGTQIDYKTLLKGLDYNKSLQRRGGRRSGEFRPNFSNSSYRLSEYVSKFGWDIRSVTAEIRRRKEERKTTAVKYKPFGITMPCGGLIKHTVPFYSRTLIPWVHGPTRQLHPAVGCTVRPIEYYWSWFPDENSDKLIDNWGYGGISEQQRRPPGTCDLRSQWPVIVVRRACLSVSWWQYLSTNSARDVGL